MSELNIRGSVRYGPGQWGLSAPVAGAKLTLRQTSVGSSDTRTIWEGTTDSRGEFSGRTQEWRRKIRIGGHEGPDPSDLLALSMRIELDGQSTVRPFAWLGDFAPSPPLIASWMPANAVVARINGRDCYTVAEVARQCVELMRTPAAADIEVPAESLLAGAGNQEGQLDQLYACLYNLVRANLSEVRGMRDVRRTVAQLKGAALEQQVRSKQAEIDAKRQDAYSQFAASMAFSRVVCTCAVAVGVPGVFTIDTAAPATIPAVIALVAPVGTVGVVTAPAVVRAVVRIASQAGGLSLNPAVDATVTIVSTVLLTALVFMLAGRQGFEWARTRVLGGRRGWKIRLS